MRSILESKPICVTLRVREHIAANGAMCAGTNQTDCNWNALLKQTLEKTYPEMIVKLGKIKDKEVNVCISFNNRPATEADVYSKLDRFFKINKSIVLGSLVIQ